MVHFIFGYGDWGKNIIPFKSMDDVLSYNYRVCEAYDCEEEGTELHESRHRTVDLCWSHYREAQRYST